MILYAIDLPYASYGVVVQDGIITRAPPIAQWMLHKRWLDVHPWLLRKKAKIEVIKLDE